MGKTESIKKVKSIAFNTYPFNIYPFQIKLVSYNKLNRIILKYNVKKGKSNEMIKNQLRGIGNWELRIGNGVQRIEK